MSPRIFVVGVVLGGFALGCDPRGISLGTEALCVADPELAAAAADSTEAISTCARVGENQLANAGFETPAVTCANGTFCQFPAAETEGWHTDDAAQVIEIWRDGYKGVPAPVGVQFVELNANAPDTLWQELALPPGQLMYWSFLHRGRNGLESLQLRIGPPDADVLQGVFSSPEDAWYQYSGLYRVGADEAVTRFALVSLADLAEGNLVDGVVFAPVE